MLRAKPAYAIDLSNGMLVSKNPTVVIIPTLAPKVVAKSRNPSLDMLMTIITNM